MCPAGRLRGLVTEPYGFTSSYCRCQLEPVQAFVRRCQWLGLLVCFRLPVLDIHPELSGAKRRRLRAVDDHPELEGGLQDAYSFALSFI
jgi:hypothetical protein